MRSGYSAVRLLALGIGPKRAQEEAEIKAGVLAKPAIVDCGLFSEMDIRDQRRSRESLLLTGLWTLYAVEYAVEYQSPEDSI